MRGRFCRHKKKRFGDIQLKSCDILTRSTETGINSVNNHWSLLMAYGR